MKKIVNVTDNDILLGIKESGYWCPITYAVSRLFPDKRIYTAIDKIAIYDFNCDEPIKSIPLVNEAKEFIQSFDRGDLVYPFSFELDYV